MVGVEVEVGRMWIIKGLGFTKGNSIETCEISLGSLSCFPRFEVIEVGEILLRSVLKCRRDPCHRLFAFCGETVGCDGEPSE